MTEFRIGRGHDGPARIGEYLMGSAAHSTPLLIGAVGQSSNIFHYDTLGRSTHSMQESFIFSIPFTMKIADILMTQVNASSSLILPSLISFASLDTTNGNLLFQHQFETLEKVKQQIDPSQMIVRVPEDVESSAFQKYISDFHAEGIRAAAFTFDGLLGSSDFTSINLRSKLPASWLAIALGKIAPSTVPLLFYLGFDMFDTGYADAAAAKGFRLWHNGTEKIQPKGHHRYCPCPSCAELENTTKFTLVDILRAHNMTVYNSILSESIEAMNSGKLRWLIESFTHTSPGHASLARIVDKYLYSFLEEFTPTSGAKAVPLIGPESYNAPVVRRYRELLASRYTPPKDKRLALLLPCSAKKPYSDSKSHKRILQSIEAALGSTSPNLAQVILTSPLGVVPRELERVFPAANYDIPVTGDWDFEETHIAADALVTHLNKLSTNCTIIAHVSGGYLGIVKTAEERITQSLIYTTPDSSPTSHESLIALQETLTDLRTLLELKSAPPRILEEIVRATADFQFGPGAGDLLAPENARLGGKPYRQIICRIGKEQLCSFISETGSLSLTIDGGIRLASLNRYWVRLEAPSVKGGSIFAVGISEADPSIRPGDEVIVLNDNGDVTAVGRSEMSGREMCDLNRGRAVSVRHKVEGDT
ncbi:hypothetical protein EU527_00445 [Candidatus Thorarchaeota archaeon]|nr:MAG: hypothetical protein EU527_00445 [Candidatus Thorarchaeota archaeon]